MEAIDRFERYTIEKWCIFCLHAIMGESSEYTRIVGSIRYKGTSDYNSVYKLI